MSKKATSILVLFLVILWVSEVSAFWIWTPETQRWINPKYSAKENARLQSEEVLKYYNKEQYTLSLREARKLVAYFPRAREAAEGQFYVGMSLEKLNKHYDAYRAYQLAIEKYPFSERIMEMIERQFEIGNLFLEKKVRHSWGSFLNSNEAAIEIFNSVIENAPYEEFAAASQYRLGLALLKAKRLYEAKEAFTKVLDNYSTSEWIDEAEYQIAVVTAQVSGGFDYDQAGASSARRQFEDFIKEHPEAQLKTEAGKRVRSLKEEEAQGNFNTARFYEKQKAYNSAKIYYQYVITHYPQSSWAQKAKKRLKKIEEKND